MVGMMQLLTYTVCLLIIVTGLGALNVGIVSGRSAPTIVGAIALVISLLGSFYLAKEQTVQAMIIGTRSTSISP